MTLIQRICHLVEMEEDGKVRSDYFLLVSVDGCMEAVCEDVSVWITGLQGSISLIQHIISGKLQVISLF